jgi:hypothetical protein
MTLAGYLPCTVPEEQSFDDTRTNSGDNGDSDASDATGPMPE